MKKVKVLLSMLAISILTFCMFALVACGGIPGTYRFSSMTMDGITIEAGESYMGVTIDEDYIVIEIEDDGTFSMSQTAGGMSVNGTWKDLGDGKIELTVDNEPLVVECDGDTLVMEQDGARITFEK